MSLSHTSNYQSLDNLSQQIDLKCFEHSPLFFFFFNRGLLGKLASVVWSVAKYTFLGEGCHCICFWGHSAHKHRGSH